MLIGTVLLILMSNKDPFWLLIDLIKITAIFSLISSNCTLVITYHRVVKN